MEINPRLRIRSVRLRVQTEAGEVGRTIGFSAGLNVLRAGNTSGKSTTLQAIIYALGLEGMLSPRREVPLPHSMTDRVSIDGMDYPVLQSDVSLEFENSSGVVVTATRQVKNSIVDNALISVEFGPGLTVPGNYESASFFVRRSGAAQREQGFHYFLSDFLGWSLPLVTHMDGSEKPLYSECLFPFFYVEQKHGWSGVQARIPTYLGIREVGKRSFEYVLGLEVFQRILSRQRIRSIIQELEGAWNNTFAELRSTAQASGVSLANVPARIADSAHEDSAALTAPVDGEWMLLGQATNSLRDALASYEMHPVRNTEDSADALERELATAESDVRVRAATLSILLEERVALKDQQTQLELRLDALGEDLQRHKDSALLVRLGARHAESLAIDHACPTCHQEVSDGLDISHHAMTIDENIAFIERQRSTFRASRDDSLRAFENVEVRISSLRAELAGSRRQVRRLKDTLVGPGNAPSFADISHRSALQNQLDAILENQRSLEALRATLRDLSYRHTTQSEALKTLASSDLSEADERKLTLVERYLRDQLNRYHFDSLHPRDVEISRQTYRPAHEGYELGFDLSASDMIRVIWSYLFAIMRVSEEEGGNHLGLLIFDEPRQQETASESYRQLLQEAAEQGARGSQIIFATSEASESLISMLGAAEFNLIDIPEGQKVLTRVSTSP